MDTTGRVSSAWMMELDDETDFDTTEMFMMINKPDYDLNILKEHLKVRDASQSLQLRDTVALWVSY